MYCLSVILAILSQRGDKFVSPYDARWFAYFLTFSRLSLDDFNVNGVDPTTFEHLMHFLALVSVVSMLEKLLHLLTIPSSLLPFMHV
jgi:hypothetical protein